MQKKSKISNLKYLDNDLHRRGRLECLYCFLCECIACKVHSWVVLGHLGVMGISGGVIVLLFWSNKSDHNSKTVWFPGNDRNACESRSRCISSLEMIFQ